KRGVLVVYAEFRARDLRQNSLDFGGKNEFITVLVIIERLFTRSIARGKQQVIGKVDNHERKHAIELVEAALTPLPIAREQNLGIAVGAKTMPQSLELFAQFEVVVDLAVIHQHLVAPRVVVNDWR